MSSASTPSASASVLPDELRYDLDTIAMEARAIHQTVQADPKHATLFQQELDHLLAVVGGAERAKYILIRDGVRFADFPSSKRKQYFGDKKTRTFLIEDLPLLRRLAKQDPVTPPLEIVQNFVRTSVDFARVHLDAVRDITRGVKGRVQNVGSQIRALVGMDGENS